MQCSTRYPKTHVGGPDLDLTYNSINNLSPYCVLVDAKIRASDKDLPVTVNRTEMRIQVYKFFQPFVRDEINE